MKRIFAWGLVFVSALVFAILVDSGKKHVGIPDYIWLSANLTLFLYVLNRFVGQPMTSFLETRREGIVEELQNARQQLEEADRLQAEVTKRLADVEDEIARLKDRAASDSEAEAVSITEQTKIDEERFLRRVDEEITRREAETRTQLARDTADLTAQLARDLLDREMTDEDRRRVLARSLEAMHDLKGGE
jgi:F0F1-type ATP synthase membrane subunit b/b'